MARTIEDPVVGKSALQKIWSGFLNFVDLHILSKRASGAPTSSTEGHVGQIYIDSATNNMYRCSAVDNGTYTWEQIGAFFSAAEKTKLAGIAANANNYSLPTASSSTLGGVKVGSNLTISDGKLSGNYSAATTSANGLMSSSDKSKLNGIASGATAVTESTVSGWGFTKNTGTYSKPSDGIPASDMDSSVQTSLGKANSALQSHQSLSACLKNNANGTIAGDSSDTPLYLKSKSASTYLGFKDTSNTTLGYYGVNSSKQPVFYNGGDVRLVLANESLKNPNALTIVIGDTTITYDGSEAKTVVIS